MPHPIKCKPMKGCGCRMCRRGMHTKGGGWLVQKAIRKARHAAKVKLRRGEEAEMKFSIGWTD